MNKKMRKIIISLILVVSFSFVSVEASEPSKGDLRCPPNSSSCEEIKNTSGNVTGVNLTTGSFSNSGDVQIIKKVRKTNTLGEYEISFDVRGKTVTQKRTEGDVYIVVVFDTSSTMQSNIGAARNAIKQFAKTLIPNNQNGNSNYHLALVQFATNMSLRRGFDNSNFEKVDICGFEECGLGRYSYLGKGLKKAYELFQSKKIPSNAKKYVVVFGDGRYYFGDGCGVFRDTKNTNCDENRRWLSELDNKKIKRFGIRFYGDRLSYELGKNRGLCSWHNYDYCDDLYMKDIDKNYKLAKNSSEYTNKFLEVANSVRSDNTSTGVTVSADLIDNIGEDFYIKDDFARFKTLDIGVITENFKSTEKFIVKIDPYTETGWHSTNDSFNLGYMSSDGTMKYTTSNVNPEVYWIQQSEEINACNGVTSLDSIWGKTDGVGYYNIVCLEGYNDNNANTLNGLTASISVNNFSITGEKINKFSLIGGQGFPVSLDLSTHVECTYQFNYQNFMKRYNEIQSLLRSAKDEKLIASLTKESQKLDGKSVGQYGILQEYIALTNGGFLREYGNRFESQTATLRLNYDQNNIDIGLAELVNVGDVISNVNCNGGNIQVINGQNVIVNQTCTASFSKKMQLEETCLDMKSGEAGKCKTDNTQLTGGNNFYIKLNQDSGKVYVDIPKTGISSRANIKLQDCTYTNTGSKVTYRQIELPDPFLKTYTNNTRKIGRNFSNEKYNFENIIKENLWSLEPEYKYSLSKVNVENIRKDTSEEGVNSYLGRDCYFNESNQYICRFTRNRYENGVDTNLFSSVKTPE